jgi:hypothetical protein
MEFKERGEGIAPSLRILSPLCFQLYAQTAVLSIRFLSRAEPQYVAAGMVTRVDGEAALRSSSGWQLRAMPLTERGEGDDLILGVPDPRLSPATDGGELRPHPDVEEELWL